MQPNDAILDAQVRHAIGLQRLSNSEVRKVLALLKRIDSRIIERLTREDLTDLGRARQAKLLRDVRSIIDAVYEDATGKLQLSLNDLAEYEQGYQRDLFADVLGVEVALQRISEDQLIAAVNDKPFQGKLLKDWFVELPEAQFRRLRDTIRMGVVEGRSIAEIVRDIRGTRANGYKDGVLEIGRRHAETTVRTAVNHTANAAAERFYKRNERLIRGVQWLSTLDTRTSPICRARDNMVYEVDKGPRPPAHPNCRSSTTPILKAFPDPDSPSYGEWLGRQNKDVQADVLGKAKAELFRAGGLPMDKFVNRAGKELTLEQLKRAEGGRGTKPKYVQAETPKSKRAANESIVSARIARQSNLDGAPMAVRSAVVAAQEMQARFGTPEIDSFGDLSKALKGARLPSGLGGAVISAKYKSGKNFVGMHFPKDFGKRSEALGEIDKNTRAAKITARNAKLAKISRPDPDLVKRIGDMGDKGYSHGVAYSLRGTAQSDAIVRHEFGHLVHDFVAKEQIDKFLDEVRPTETGWDLLLSQYAGTLPIEYVAEAFTAYTSLDRGQRFRIHPKLLSIFEGLDKFR